MILELKKDRRRVYMIVNDEEDFGQTGEEETETRNWDIFQVAKALP